MVNERLRNASLSLHFLNCRHESASPTLNDYYHIIISKYSQRESETRNKASRENNQNYKIIMQITKNTKIQAYIDYHLMINCINKTIFTSLVMLPTEYETSKKKMYIAKAKR